MMKKITKLVTLLLALAMVFSLAACSSGKGKDKADGSADIATLIATEPNSADEAAKLYQQLMQKENDILAANSELWNKVFLSANKNSTMIEDGTNYGDFLLATIESASRSVTSFVIFFIMIPPFDFDGCLLVSDSCFRSGRSHSGSGWLAWGRRGCTCRSGCTPCRWGTW